MELCVIKYKLSGTHVSLWSRKG